MEPFRAFVADLLPEDSAHARIRDAEPVHWVGRGGRFGAALSADNVFHVRADTSGAARFLSPCVFRFISARRHFSARCFGQSSPRRNIRRTIWQNFGGQKAEHAGLAASAREIFASIREMPQTMRQLAGCRMLHLAGTVLHVAVLSRWRWRTTCSALRTRIRRSIPAGVEWAGVCFGMYSLVCFGFSFVPAHAGQRVRPQDNPHLCLICGAAGTAFRGRDPRQISAAAFDDGRRDCAGPARSRCRIPFWRDRCPRKDWRLHGNL